MIEGSRKDKHKSKSKKNSQHYKMKRFITYFTAFLLLIGIGFGGYLVYLAINIDNIALGSDANSSGVYSRNDLPLGIVTSQRGDYVQLRDINPNFINAVVAVEDNVFYRHLGVNPLGIARALYTNIINRRTVQGGSTITQQLAKNVFLTHDRTLDRKLKELVYTLKLERTYSKDEILEAYLNAIFYGHGIYGVGSATQFYFGKAPNEINVAEAALLAGIIQGPHYYSPAVPRNLEPRAPEGEQNIESESAFVVDGDITTSRTYRRRNFALFRMYQEEYITEEQLNEAREQPIKIPVEQQREGFDIPPYVLTELDSIEIELGYESGQLRVGYNIFTTLDEDAQQVAQQTMDAYESFIPENKHNDPNVQAALVSIDPETGGIMAIAESGPNKFRAAFALPQPGSAFKPIAYALALESQKYTLINQHFCQNLAEAGILNYNGSDYGTRYHHEYLTLRRAMAESCNIYAVLTNVELGPRNVISLARDMGYHEENPLAEDAQMVLGSNGAYMFSMASVYATFANGGLRVQPFIISEIQDRFGNTVYRRNPQRPQRVISNETAFLITDLLRDVIRSPQGTARGAQNLIPNRDAAVKTGSTFDYAYSAGYTPEMVTIAYIGNDTPTGDLGLTGGVITSKLWASYTNTALNRIYGEDVGETFTIPAGIEEKTLCRESLLLATPNCPEPFNEYFVRGTGPDTYCNIHQNTRRDVDICTSSWKRATTFCPHNTIQTFRFQPGQQVPPEDCDVHTRVRWPNREEGADIEDDQDLDFEDPNGIEEEDNDDVDEEEEDDEQDNNH